MAASTYYNWDNPIKVGFWGSKYGETNVWSFMPNGAITEITVTYDNVIYSLSFKIVDQNGEVHNSDTYGSKGKNEHVIKLDWPKEYVKSVNWTMANADQYYVIQSICFQTNINKYGPYGPTNGAANHFDTEDGVMVGYHGCRGKYLDAIGFYIKNSTELFSSAKVNPIVKDGTTMMMDLPRPLGPWGGISGKPWDDAVYKAVDQIVVYVENGIVRGIHVQYQSKYSKPVESKRHGGNGNTAHRITLDGEYLQGVAGHYGPVHENGGLEAIRSLSFYTNKGKYGPFGDEIGIFFHSPVYDAGKVVGFHGKGGAYLDALGVHIE